MNFSDIPISEKDSKKIIIPEFLLEETNKKINIPSFLIEPQVDSQGFDKTTECTPYWCGNCETSTQQCRECTSCQGCEDNCQHGPCESACMDYCEVNGECDNCLKVCQTTCQKSCQTTCEASYQCSCQSCESCESSCQYTCQSSAQGHTHVWKYTDWQYANSSSCKRLKYCDGAGTCPVGATEEYQSHSYWVTRYEWVSSSGCKPIFRCSYCGHEKDGSTSAHVWEVVKWEQGNETHCEKHLRCSACKGTTVQPVRHEFVNGICKWCGREEIPFPPNFQWTSPKVKGSPFYFGVDEYKTYVEYLNQKLAYFKKTKVSKTTVTKGEKVLATTMNELLSGLRRLNATGVPSNVSAGEAITASFLNALRDSLNSVKKIT